MPEASLSTDLRVAIVPGTSPGGSVAGHPAGPPPYAAPLNAVDEMQVSTVDGGGLLVTAVKEIVASDPYLAAHFPGRTVYPGVFVLETVRQAVAAALGERAGVLPDLSAVHSLRFVGMMHPGEQLRVAATVGPPGPDGAVRVAARCHRDDGTEVARLAVEFRYEEDADA